MPPVPFPMASALWAALPAALLLPLAVQACPADRAAAMAGVVVTLDGGAVSRLTLGEDGVVVEEVSFDDEGYRVTALHGLWVFEEVDLFDGEPDPASAERQAFEGGPGALPDPAPGLEWSGLATVTLSDVEPFQRIVSVSLGQPESVTYGGCSYDSWPARVTKRDDLAAFTLHFDYLPALGVAVLRAYEDEGEPAERITPLAIAPAAP